MRPAHHAPCRSSPPIRTISRPRISSSHLHHITSYLENKGSPLLSYAHALARTNFHILFGFTSIISAVSKASEMKRHRQSSSASQGPSGDVEERGIETIDVTAEFCQSSKYRQLEHEHERQVKISCDLPPHNRLSFATQEDYEIHYQQSHVNRCIECRKNFPTEHLLSLHIAENHDPLNASRRDRGAKTYACFVEGCDKVCSDWKRRRMHLVDKHFFPRNYDFFIVNDGTEGRSSLLRTESTQEGRAKNGSLPNRTRDSKSERREKAQKDKGQNAVVAVDVTDMEVANSAEPLTNIHTPAAIEVDDLSSSFSSLRLIPPSVRFGRRKAGQGLASS